MNLRPLDPQSSALPNCATARSLPASPASGRKPTAPSVALGSSLLADPHVDPDGAALEPEGLAQARSRKRRCPLRCSTSSSTWAISCASDMSLVSTTTASGAARSGDTGPGGVQVIAATDVGEHRVHMPTLRAALERDTAEDGGPVGRITQAGAAGCSLGRRRSSTELGISSRTVPYLFPHRPRFGARCSSNTSACQQVGWSLTSPKARFPNRMRRSAVTFGESPATRCATR